MKTKIGQLLDFQQTNDLGMYLGIPLFNSRVKKITFQFVVDKNQNKLNGYDAHLLSLLGRITLAKFVVLMIPSYFMQATLIPTRVSQKIEMIVRQFVLGIVTKR